MRGLSIGCVEDGRQGMIGIEPSQCTFLMTHYQLSLYRISNGSTPQQAVCMHATRLQDQQLYYLYTILGYAQLEVQLGLRIGAWFGTKVALVGQLQADTSCILASLVADRVAPPLQLNLGHLESEKDDNGSNGNTARPSSSEDKVVFRPKGEVSLFNVDPGECSHVDGWSHV